MKIHIETDRLFMRDLVLDDAAGILELDADPDVHLYLGNKPIQTIQEAEANINFIRNQYLENGIGRWAVIEKETGSFIGWSGFKYIRTMVINGRTDYYDLGYRFIKKYWGKGYATETAIASLHYGFNQLQQSEICAFVERDHLASNRILQKIGMTLLNAFNYEAIPHNFYSISKKQWEILYTK